MAKFSLLTAMEIFTNPHDLLIVIGQPKENGNYVFEICRGPGHDYKILLNTTPVFTKKEEVVKKIGEILTVIQEACKEELEDKKSVFHPIFGPIDLAKVLNAEIIEHIIKELENKSFINTCEIKV